MTLVVEGVAVAGLAPAPVCVLRKNQPVDGSSDLRRTRTYAGSVECAQHRPRPVDVIHSPTSVPAAVVFLAPSQKLDRCRQRGPVRFFAELRNHAHAPPRYFGGRRAHTTLLAPQTTHQPLSRPSFYPHNPPP